VRHTGHLGGDCSECFALEVRVFAVLGDIALILIPKCIFTLSDGHLSRHPEGSSKPGIAELRQFALTTKLSRLVGGKVKATELQKLTVMFKTSNIASLCEDCEGIDRTDPRDLPETDIIWVLTQNVFGVFFI